MEQTKEREEGNIREVACPACVHIDDSSGGGGVQALVGVGLKPEDEKGDGGMCKRLN